MTEATIIENKNRNAAEDASIAVAENARELDWNSKPSRSEESRGGTERRPPGAPTHQKKTGA